MMSVCVDDGEVVIHDLSSETALTAGTFERLEQLELVQDVQAVQIVQFKPNGQVGNGWLVLQAVALRYVEKNRSHDHRAEGDNQAEGSELPDVAIVPQLPNRHRHDL